MKEEKSESNQNGSDFSNVQMRYKLFKTGRPKYFILKSSLDALQLSLLNYLKFYDQ